MGDAGVRLPQCIAKPKLSPDFLTWGQGQPPVTQGFGGRTQRRHMYEAASIGLGTC